MVENILQSIIVMLCNINMMLTVFSLHFSLFTFTFLKLLIGRLPKSIKSISLTSPSVIASGSKVVAKSVYIRSLFVLGYKIKEPLLQWMTWRIDLPAIKQSSSGSVCNLASIN